MCSSATPSSPAISSSTASSRATSASSSALTGGRQSVATATRPTLSTLRISAAGFKGAGLVIDDGTLLLESSHRRDLPGQTQLLPARSDPVVGLPAQRGALREHGQVAVVLAGVD